MSIGLLASRTSVVRQVKTWAARRFLARVQRITQRMPVELRQVERGRIMVLAPHMDDEVIGAGGTLAIHQHINSTLEIVFTTDCAGPKVALDGKSTSEIRQEEARQVADRFGYEIVGMLAHPDGNLSLHEEECRENLARLISEWKPDQIFVPFPGDHHRDHQATAASLAGAITKTGWRGNVWCHEV